MLTIEQVQPIKTNESNAEDSLMEQLPNRGLQGFHLLIEDQD